MRARCAVALAGLLAAAPLPAQTAADTASVQAFYEAWFGPAQQDPVRYASFYEPAGTLLPPGGQPVQGREAIAAWQRRSSAEATYATSPEGIRVDEIRFLSSEWVVYRGTLWGRRVPRNGGPTTPFETKYFDLLHRTAEGWKISYRMWSESR